MNMFLVCTVLLCSSFSLHAAAGNSKIEVSITGFISGANIERRTPVINDEIDFERRETVSGKNFGILQKEAYQKGVPWLIVPVLLLNNPKPVFDYFDGYTILSKCKQIQSAKEEILYYLQTNYTNQCHMMTVLKYPEGHSDCDEILFNFGNDAFNELDSVVKLYFQNDPFERVKLAQFYVHIYQNRNKEHHHRPLARITKFWLDQVDLNKPDLTGQPLSKTLREIKTYLAQ